MIRMSWDKRPRNFVSYLRGMTAGDHRLLTPYWFSCKYEVVSLGALMRQIFCLSFWMWIIIGIALDASVLSLLYSALNAFGPLNNLVQETLIIVVILAVTWFIHVLALSLIFRLSIARPIRVFFNLAAGIFFVAIAFVLVVFVGLCSFFVVGGLFYLIMLAAGFRQGFGLLPPTLLEQLGDYAGWMLIATPVGAAIGAMLYAFRGLYGLGLGLKPTVFSDVFGGACGAFLALGGMFVANSFNLFLRQESAAAVATSFHTELETPQIPTLAVIGTIALLPHLLMTGADLLHPNRS